MTETEGLPRWRVRGQVCCVSIPPGPVLPHRRHVNAGSSNPLAEQVLLQPRVQPCVLRGESALVRRVRQEGRLRSEKFSVNSPRFSLRFAGRHFRTAPSRLVFVCCLRSLSVTLRGGVIFTEMFLRTKAIRRRHFRSSQLPSFISLDLFLYSHFTGLSRSRTGW